MPGIKPTLTEEQVVSLLQQHFSASIEHLVTIDSGQIAQTFSYSVEGQEYIIRFNKNHMGANFAKEAYIAKRVTSPLIPMPTFVHIGRYQGLHYSISLKIPGRMLDTLPPAEYGQLLLDGIKTLDAIHHVDVRDWPPLYGVFSDDGVGHFPSWRSYLSSVREEEEEWNFYGKWHTLFEHSFLERDVFDSLYGYMSRLLDACPEERFLVHGGFGFSNVIAHEGRIAGVLDWIGAKYGDFVYDIAWLDFWSPEGSHSERFQHYYDAQGITVPTYHERLRCYHCFISLDALRFFAKSNQPKAYQWTRKRIFDLLN